MAIESRPFSTRARTLDHLGREQIADVPTAISELWKNAYDAYATEVKLSVFEGNKLVASLFDDGHGMTKDDIVEKWLVIGTDTKLSDDKDGSPPYFGLNYRPKQGQKGIGRLSSAHLGPLLLLISKSEDSSNFVALMIDWRIFENPFLFLSDVVTPITEAPSLSEVFEELPSLIKALQANVTPQVGKNASDHESARAARILEAWKLFDSATMDGLYGPAPETKPSLHVVQTAAEAEFKDAQIEDWPVASGSKDHGTALIVYDANQELQALFSKDDEDDDKNRFIQTLSGFVDPYIDTEDGTDQNAEDVDLTYSVETSSSGHRKIILSSDIGLTRDVTDEMEHVLEGTIDTEGNFLGTIKVFGKWLNEGKPIEIPAPSDFSAPTGQKTKLGPFSIYLATFEQVKSNSTHTDDDFAFFGRFNRFSGLRIYRNGLRVMPYGRTDNDFFEIESRRSTSAGRHYWNDRRMFGRIAIQRQRNPNLRDKAGREGFIVNSASRALKKLVIHLLTKSAYDYFGSNSPIRKEELPEIQRKNAEKKAADAKKKLAAHQRRTFRSNLRRVNNELPDKVQAARANFDKVILQSADEIPAAQELLEESRQLLTESRVPGRPKELRNLEHEYAEYQHTVGELRNLVEEFAAKLENWMETLEPQAPEDIIEQQLRRHQGSLHSRVSKWSRRIKDLQGEEISRVQDLVRERNKILNELAQPIITRLKAEQIGLNEASKSLNNIWQTIEHENQDIFENYILALESLKESIDLQTIAVMGEQENAELRVELDRLNALAQLGIAIEILGHELQTYENMIGRGLSALPTELREAKNVGKLIEAGYTGLTQQLRFLTPLQLSGERSSRKITGTEISEYLEDFFGKIFDKAGIEFDTTEKFLNFSVRGQPARLLPVFINLVNNSQYWLSHAIETEKKITIDVVDDEVVVADNGPGVNDLDVEKLFSLFFTKKISGGRGIGLYLCKANLAAGFHEISYVTNEDRKVLSGANFSIKFKNAEFET
ncbi:ATP-binding protein [Sulfitobacter sp.]|jgi:signal transduction histidine kinase|uniref:ATP-binding protein n=1 Tax=Sulfitobacter sp. TaxID=1903071 RepID=UPI0039E5F78F